LADMRWIWDLGGRGSWTRPEDETWREWLADMALERQWTNRCTGLTLRVVSCETQGWEKIIERGH
jgi:hypothetical protein